MEKVGFLKIKDFLRNLNLWIFQTKTKSSQAAKGEERKIRSALGLHK